MIGLISSVGSKRGEALPSKTPVWLCNWMCLCTVNGQAQEQEHAVQHCKSTRNEIGKHIQACVFRSKDCFNVQENIAAFNVTLDEDVLKEIDVVHAAARDPSNRPLN